MHILLWQRLAKYEFLSQRLLTLAIHNNGSSIGTKSSWIYNKLTMLMSVGYEFSLVNF